MCPAKRVFSPDEKLASSTSAPPKVFRERPWILYCLIRSLVRIPKSKVDTDNTALLRANLRSSFKKVATLLSSLENKLDIAFRRQYIS